MRAIDPIVVHCAATPDDPDHQLYNANAATIRAWHTDPRPRGLGWSDIGYHHVIRRDGRIEIGRLVERPGAHAKGFNANSVGVCLIGTRGFTPRQWHAFEQLVTQLRQIHRGAQIRGHNDLTRAKERPCFDVPAWWAAVERQREEGAAA